MHFFLEPFGCVSPDRRFAVGFHLLTKVQDWLFTRMFGLERLAER